MNCPRYMHRFQKVSPSRYMPRAEAETPLCEWKRIDGLQDVLRPKERAEVEKAGNITVDDWMGKVFSDDEEA